MPTPSTIARHLAVTAATLLSSVGLAQTTYHVDPAGSGAGGTSWATAFTNLHAALAAAQADDTIKVGMGTYRPDVGHPTRPVGDRLAYWNYKGRVTLRGGYRGLSGGGSPDDQHPGIYPSILSGDIGVQGVETDNSLTLMNANVGGSIIIDSFTFRDCYQDTFAGLPQGHYGSALWSFGSPSIALTRCSFRDNTTVNNGQVGHGGTVFLFNTPGTISNCDFRGNRIRGSQFQTVAAGLFIWQSDLSISQCEFFDNRNESTGGASYAGAMYIEHGFPVISNCLFTNNSAVSGGGAVFHRNAWQPPPNALSNRFGAPTFTGCTFEGNTSNQGAGVWLWSIRPDDVGRFTNCRFQTNTSGQNGAAIFSNPGGASFMQVRIEGTLFTGNQSGFATFANCYDGAADLTVSNCTAVGNGPARAFSCGGSAININNSILRGQPGSGQPLVWTGNTVPTTFRNSNVEGATLAHHTLINHQSEDPQFSPQAPFISQASPCFNSGDNALVPATLTTDLWFTPRIQGDSVDRGVHEIDLRPSCGNSDYNGDGDFGTDQDIEAFFACLAGNCCATCCSCGSDFNGDGDFGTDQDIESFFRVLAGGNC